MTDIWLKLTEPNDNPIWVNRSRIECLYAQSANDGKGGVDTYTTVVVSGLKLTVIETPEYILGIVPITVDAAIQSPGERSHR